MSSVRLRLSFVAYVLVFSVVGRYNVQSECVSLELFGSRYHSNTDGIYLLDGHNLCNGRRIWIQESGEHYLYYVLDGYDGWTIGPWSCHRGDFLIYTKTTAEKPYVFVFLQLIWKEFADEASVWQNNFALHILCVDDNRQLIKCETIPCENGGSCMENDGRSVCSCQRGFYGLLCETAIDTSHCRSHPCMNGASCFDLVNDFQCRCAPGFSGRQCNITTNVIDCEVWPCHADCVGKEAVTICTSLLRTIYILLPVVSIFGMAMLVILIVINAVSRHRYKVSANMLAELQRKILILEQEIEVDGQPLIGR